MSIIGENIKVLRKAVGYSSVYKFATAVGLPEKRVDAWERGNGKPKVDDTIIVAKFFGIDFQLLRDKSLSQSEAEKIAAKLKPLKSDTTEHRRNRDSNGTITYTGIDKTTPMSKMIALSLSELLQLQTEVHDVEMTKAISQVIQLKQRIEYLEKENGKLEHDNEFLKELIKKK